MKSAAEEPFLFDGQGEDISEAGTQVQPSDPSKTPSHKPRT
jgi:hypothetical protein